MSNDLVLWQDTVDDDYYGLGIYEGCDTSSRPVIQHATKLADFWEDCVDDIFGMDVRKAAQAAKGKMVKVRITCEILED